MGEDGATEHPIPQAGSNRERASGSFSEEGAAPLASNSTGAKFFLHRIVEQLLSPIGRTANDQLHPTIVGLLRAPMETKPIVVTLEVPRIGLCFELYSRASCGPHFIEPGTAVLSIGIPWGQRDCYPQRDLQAGEGCGLWNPHLSITPAEPPVLRSVGPINVDYVEQVAVRVRESDEVAPRLGRPREGSSKTNEALHLRRRVRRVEVQVEPIFIQCAFGGQGQVEVGTMPSRVSQNDPIRLGGPARNIVEASLQNWTIRGRSVQSMTIDPIQILLPVAESSPSTSIESSLLAQARPWNES